jgi:hypothetical protein
MRKFTKVVNKDIENIYKEFEDLFTDCVQNAEFSCIENEFSKGLDLPTFDIIRNNRFLELGFEEVIKSIKMHLAEQFKPLTPISLISFIQKQDEYYSVYLPKVRKKINYANYVNHIIYLGDEPFDFKPSENHIEFLKFVFGTYEAYYFELKKACDLLFEKYREILVISKPKIINWVELIEPAMLPLIENAEKKANHKSSAIRCAAFCELLFEKKYIKPTKTRVKTLTTFAASRYGINISNALQKTKQAARNEHKNLRKSGFEPLNKSFK